MLMPNVNYAHYYSEILRAKYPYALYFGALYSAPENGNYQFQNGNEVLMPQISTSGRTDSDRTGQYKRGTYANNWVSKKLENERQWNIPLHPRDIEETNGAIALENLIQDHFNFHVFPEKDAYTISKIYYDYTIEEGGTVITDDVTTANILDIIDKMMINMDNARVPFDGRILYVTHEFQQIINNVQGFSRNLNAEGTSSTINRLVSNLDKLSIIAVPSELMKTCYDFTEGWAVDPLSEQINMFMIHPSAVITPDTYSYAGYEEPSPSNFGIGTYFEEMHDDVFILPERAVAIQFHVTYNTPEQSASVNQAYANTNLIKMQSKNKIKYAEQVEKKALMNKGYNVIGTDGKVLELSSKSDKLLIADYQRQNEELKRQLAEKNAKSK